MIQLASLLLTLFSFIGFLGFVVGLTYSLRNNQLTKYASSLWFMFCAGMIFACLWALAASISYLDVYSGIFQVADHIFLACFASFLLAVTYMSFTGDIKLM
jgi:hypothetical protein